MPNANDTVDAIVKHMKANYNMAMGQKMAERIANELGDAAAVGANSADVEVRGRDLPSAAPRRVIIPIEELRQAVRQAR